MLPPPPKTHTRRSTNTSLKGSDSPSFTAVTPSLDLLGTAFGNLDHSVVHQPIKSAPLSSRRISALRSTPPVDFLGSFGSNQPTSSSSSSSSSPSSSSSLPTPNPLADLFTSSKPPLASSSTPAARAPVAESGNPFEDSPDTSRSASMIDPVEPQQKPQQTLSKYDSSSSNSSNEGSLDIFSDFTTNVRKDSTIVVSTSAAPSSSFGDVDSHADESPVSWSLSVSSNPLSARSHPLPSRKLVSPDSSLPPSYTTTPRDSRDSFAISSSSSSSNSSSSTKESSKVKRLTSKGSSSSSSIHTSESASFDPFLVRASPKDPLTMWEEDEAVLPPNIGTRHSVASTQPPPPAGPPPAHVLNRHSRTVSQPPIPTPPVNNPDVIRIDALAKMKEGAPFLKYGKMGYPHFRQVQLSPDNLVLMWFSSSKKLANTQVRLRDIDEIVLGQKTANFRRHPAPELERISFSILYGGRKNTLDLVAGDTTVYAYWTRTLQDLIPLAQSDEEALRKRTHHYLEMRAIKKKPDSQTSSSSTHPKSPSQEKISSTDSPNSPDIIEKDLPASADKSQYRPTLQRLKDLRKDLSKIVAQLKTDKYYASPVYASMVDKVNKITRLCVDIDEFLSAGDADRECWRTGIEMESLENMMKAALQ